MSRERAVSRIFGSLPGLTLSSTPHSPHPDSLGNIVRRNYSTRSKTLKSSRRLRSIHTSSQTASQATATGIPDEAQTAPPPNVLQFIKKDDSIRSQLRSWQALHGVDVDLTSIVDHDDAFDTSDIYNGLTRLPSLQESFGQRDQEEEEETRRSIAQFMLSPTRDLDGAATDARYLKSGDLVELDYPGSERESVIGVFVRRVGYQAQAQVFTMDGRYLHVNEKNIQYSVPGWVSSNEIVPILPYLPDPKDVQESEDLRAQAYVSDLSVPREVSAGLVSKMVQFHNEAQDIYRRNANALDTAHDALSHATDLRYGSLLSAATILLNMPADKLPVTALFTVRKALIRAGFAFDIHRQSHRRTGYLQIRSREQVKMMEQVRQWIRDWQDDLAWRALKDESGSRKRNEDRTPRTARHVYSFLEKARKIILKSRKNRDATPYGNIGPSKRASPVGPEGDWVKETTDTQFSYEDTLLIKFIEAWVCSNMFFSMPRLQSLPALLLQGTGLYDDSIDLSKGAGYLFLQELGTILPYENRVRFDQHLLLPSSQHSKPLATLADTLREMRKNPELQDTMRDLRTDWKGMPVYCIDSASAHEIDDGISIETAGHDQWWVRVHVANPTAFFARDHPLAKMARHMGETIYMPEKAHLMLPSWAAEMHFSLAPDRPCLTFSIKLDAEGNTIEHTIESGIVRNVISVTPKALNQVLGASSDQTSELVLRVGGDAPPQTGGEATGPELTAKQQEDLKCLHTLAQKRAGIRERAGAMNFDSGKPDIAVWQSWGHPGIKLSDIHREGSRVVEGDPVIQMRTKGWKNWFTRGVNPANSLVQEMMLLACETAAKWCSERSIPAIFRGMLKRPYGFDSDTFYREILLPAMRESPDGTYPLHLGIQYLRGLGSTALSDSPFRHTLLGMDYYGKVTSPLRRYGDMILHWQIEAAIREEARTGQSLITAEKSPDRKFLPFSKSVLETIMLGLQPRENIVSRAKSDSEQFWINMLLFRAFHYDEQELPFYTEAHPYNADGTRKELMRCLVQTGLWAQKVVALCMQLNTPCFMNRPDQMGLEAAQAGDVWECELDHINVYERKTIVRPVRLVHREKLGPKEINDIMAGRDLAGTVA